MASAFAQFVKMIAIDLVSLKYLKSRERRTRSPQELHIFETLKGFQLPATSFLATQTDSHRLSTTSQQQKPWQRTSCHRPAMAKLLRLLTSHSFVQSTPSVDLDHLDLLNDLSVPVELDVGYGWQVLEPWQTRRMAKEDFKIRLTEDHTVECRISREHLQNLHERVVQTSKHLDSFSEIIRAEAKKVWSQIYLPDDPTGSFQFINDLSATVEVNYGDRWCILYPKQERMISAESFTIRLRDAPAVTSPIHPQQHTQQFAAAPVTLRSAKDLEEFTAKAIDWVKTQERKIEKETEDKERRKKVLEDKAAEIARKRAYRWLFALMVPCAALVVLAFLYGLIELACFFVTVPVVFLLLRTLSCSARILVKIAAVTFLAIAVLMMSFLLFLLIGTLGSSAKAVFRGLLCFFLGIAIGIVVHAYAAGGFLREEDQKDEHERLKEENIVFEGTVSEERPG